MLAASEDDLPKESAKERKKKPWLKGVERKSSCYVFVVSENICEILETEI